MRGVIKFRGYFLLTCCYISTQGVTIHESPQSLLYHSLLDGNQIVRPVRDWTQPVNVSVHVKIYAIQELNSVDQTLSVTGTILLAWLHEFLSWNSTENGISRIQVPARKIWTPELAIMNSAVATFKDKKWLDYDTIINSDGLVTWAPSGLFTTSCNIDILYFPFDVQTCHIIIGSWMLQSNEILLTCQKLSLGGYANNEWGVKNPSFTCHTSPNQFIPDRSVVKITLELERRFVGYIPTLVMPLLLIPVIGMLVFLLPPESGEKVSLSVTILLAFSVYQLLLSESLPKSSEDIPYLMLYIVALMGINVSSTVMTVFVMHVHHKNKASSLSTWARKFVFGFLAKITCASKPTNEISPNSNGKSEEAKYPEEEGVKVDDLETKESECKGNDLQFLMVKTIKDVHKITEKIEADKEEGRIKEEWRRAAEILDRLFLIVTVIIWLVALAAIAIIFMLR